MLEKLLELVAGLPTNAVLKEHREFILAQLKAATERIEELEGEVARLKAHQHSLDQEIASSAVKEYFAEHDGVLFKRLDGREGKTFSGTPYCPNCKRAMSIAQGTVYCKPCDLFREDFAEKIPRILSELASGGHG